MGTSSVINTVIVVGGSISRGYSDRIYKQISNGDEANIPPTVERHLSPGAPVSYLGGGPYYPWRIKSRLS